MISSQWPWPLDHEAGHLNELSDEGKCWNTKCPVTLLIVRNRLCWHPVRCVHSHYPHVALIRAVCNEALLVTHIVEAWTEPCLTTLMKHFERTETHTDATQRPRYEETLQVHRSLRYAADVLTVSQYLPYSPQRITVHHICCLCDTKITWYLACSRWPTTTLPYRGPCLFQGIVSWQMDWAWRTDSIDPRSSDPTPLPFGFLRFVKDELYSPLTPTAIREL